MFYLVTYLLTNRRKDCQKYGITYVNKTLTLTAHSSELGVWNNTPGTRGTIWLVGNNDLRWY